MLSIKKKIYVYSHTLETQRHILRKRMFQDRSTRESFLFLDPEGEWMGGGREGDKEEGRQGRGGEKGRGGKKRGGGEERRKERKKGKEEGKRDE